MTPSNQTIVRHTGRAALRLVALGGLFIALAGCNRHMEAKRDNYPDDIRHRHPITLKEGRQTVEVFLGRYRGELMPSQRADVLAFAQSWRHDATSGIIVEVPTNKATARSASDALRQIYSIFAAARVPRDAVQARNYRAPGTALASIKLNYAKMVASAGPCGEWPKDLGPSSAKHYLSNNPYWNFGCSSQHNLAAQIANPADLVQPRGMTPASEARRSVAIDKYIQGEAPSGKYNDYDKAKISDLGK